MSVLEDFTLVNRRTGGLENNEASHASDAFVNRRTGGLENLRRS